MLTSGMGQKRRFGDVRVPSALPLKADILRKRRHVSKVPKAAVAYRLMNWKERPPCKRHLLRAGNVNLLRLTFLNRGNGLADDLDNEIRL